MSSVHTLQDLLVEELKGLYDVEKQLVKAIPKLAKAATDANLRQNFNIHLEQTKTHVQRLEEIFSRFSIPAKARTSKAIQGLISEGGDAVDLHAPDAIRDAGLIGAAQRVEHYEIAAYGTARAFAEALGESEVVDLLDQTLDEEKATNAKLTSLSQMINHEANAIAVSNA